MSSVKPPPALYGISDGRIGPTTRRVLAWGLEAASAALSRGAARLLRSSAAPCVVDARVEFHAVAGGAGALYVDGELVGWVEGVQRL